MTIKARKLTFLLFITTMTLYGCGKPTLEEQTESVNRALQQKNFVAATNIIKQVVLEFPNDQKARILLADTYFKLGDMDSAISHYEKAIDLGVSPTEFSNTYFLALYTNAENKKLTSQFELFKDKLSSPQIAYFHALSGIISARHADFIRGNMSLTKAARSSGSTPELITLQKLLRYFIGGDNQNSQLLNDAIEAHPDSWLIHSLVAEIAYRIEDYSLAAKTYEAMVESKPFFLPIRLNLTQTYLQLGDYNAAEKNVTFFAKRVKNHPLANQQLSLIYINKKEYQKANLYIEKSIKSGLSSTLTSYIAGLTSFQIENYEQSLKHLSRVIDLAPGNHMAKQMYVAAQLKMGDDQQAAQELLYNPQLAKANTHLAMATSYKLLMAGKKQDATRLLAALDGADKTDPQLAQELGLIKIASGDTDAGMKLIEDSSQAIISGNVAGGTKMSKALLLSVHISAGDLNKANSLLNDWMTEEPKNIDNYLLAAELAEINNQVDQAQSFYKQVLEYAPSNRTAMLKTAVKAFEQNKYPEAFNTFEKMVAAAPNDRAAIEGYIRSGIASGDNQQSLLSKVIADKNITPLSKAFAYHITNNFETVIEILESNTFSIKNMELVTYLLADSFVNSGKSDQAIALLNAYSEQHAASDLLLMTQAQAYFSAKRYTDALNVLKLVTTSTQVMQDKVLLTEAQIYVAKRQPPKAMEALSSASDSMQQTQNWLFLAGRTNLALGNIKSAVQQLSVAYQQTPADITTQYYYHALKADGQEKQAEDLVTQHVSQFPQHTHALMTIADHYASTQPSLAVSYYQKLLDLEPQNWVAMNNLAWLLNTQNKSAEASEIIQQAISLQPENTALQNTLHSIQKRL